MITIEETVSWAWAGWESMGAVRESHAHVIHIIGSTGREIIIQVIRRGTEMRTIPIRITSISTPRPTSARGNDEAVGEGLKMLLLFLELLLDFNLLLLNVLLLETVTDLREGTQQLIVHGIQSRNLEIRKIYVGKYVLMN